MVMTARFNSKTGAVNGATAQTLTINKNEVNSTVDLTLQSNRGLVIVLFARTQVMQNYRFLSVGFQYSTKRF